MPWSETRADFNEHTPRSTRTLLPRSGFVQLRLCGAPHNRKGADGLALLAKETLGHDPMKGATVVFRAKRADRVKIVVWDGTGLVMYWKRLDGGGFKWPPIVAGVMRMNAAQLSALCPVRISASSSLLVATMNQKSSLRKIPLFVSQALTANSLALRPQQPGLAATHRDVPRGRYRSGRSRDYLCAKARQRPPAVSGSKAASTSTSWICCASARSRPATRRRGGASWL
ncbi:IS66 family insertion sequence element accessory protein TnpB [Bradyrhizobium elkanii]|uniref:IS66 family insertion sequence element accessory protein TnpB n=1 Tax=Bradyrhizobium elkanii TaxID=29448 RepID=UPI003B968F8C